MLGHCCIEIAAVLTVLAIRASSQASSCPWTAEADQANSSFGDEVKSAGDVNGDGYDDVLVGASGFDNDLTNTGRACLYMGSAAGLAANPAWISDGIEEYERRGASLASGDVNADGYDDVLVVADVQFGKGSVFLYRGRAAGLAANPVWTAEGDGLLNSSADMGDVNGDGYDDLLVGAPWFTNPTSYEGHVYLYLGSATWPATTAVWTVESGQFQTFFGRSVATADVNGDGYDDVVVGAPCVNNGEPTVGRVYVYLGSATGPSTTPDWTAEGEGGALFGHSVASAGDIDGDGYEDVVVGAPTMGAGAAAVYLGSPTGLDSGPAWFESGSPDAGFFGTSVSGAGDVNGDGHDDVLIGAGGSRALLYLGSAAGLSTSPIWNVQQQAQSSFGNPVSGAGDVNGDGYDDLIVGAPYHDNGEPNEGRVFAYLGAASFVSSAVFHGDGINADTVAPVNLNVGATWSAPLTLGHSHGTGGPVSLSVRSFAVNGPTVTSPIGGRLAENLVAGPYLAVLSGSHDGATGGIATVLVPGSASLVGLPWAAQYTVLGGGFADLSQAVFGVIGCQ